MFLASGFRWCLVFSASHCILTTAVFRCQWVDVQEWIVSEMEEDPMYFFPIRGLWNVVLLNMPWPLPPTAHWMRHHCTSQNKTHVPIKQETAYRRPTRDHENRGYWGSGEADTELAHWGMLELICKVSNTLPLLIIKDLTDRTLRWPSNLAISIVHQKNHQ